MNPNGSARLFPRLTLPSRGALKPHATEETRPRRRRRRRDRAAPGRQRRTRTRTRPRHSGRAFAPSTPTSDAKEADRSRVCNGHGLYLLSAQAKPLAHFANLGLNRHHRGPRSLSRQPYSPEGA
ncbi:hypothetical protein H8959_007847 [Pygathrix nigripes]